MSQYPRAPHNNISIRYLMLLITLGLGLCYPVTSGGAVPDEAEGWAALWGNDFQKAEEIFQEILEDDSKKFSAQRGLILTLWALGGENDLMEVMKDYSGNHPVGAYDFLLLDLVQDVSFLESKKFNQGLLKFARRIAEEDDLDLVDRRMAEGRVLDYYEVLGEAEKVTETAERLNRVKNFAVLGPFDNTSGSGHRKQHITEFRYNPLESRIGKFGQTVRWFNPSLVSLGGEFYPAAYFHRKYNTTAYLLTKILVPSQGSYLLSFGYGGDVEFYLNGEKFQSWTEEMGGTETRQLELTLPQGWVELGFKLSGTDDLAWITCSVSNVDGSTVKGLKVDPLETNPYGWGGREFEDMVVREHRSGWFKTIRELAESNPDNLEAVFWNLHRASLEEDAEELDRLYEEARLDYPDCALIQWMAIPADGGRGNSLEASVDRTLELAPDFAAALILKASLDLKKKRYDLVVEAMDTVLDSSQDCYGARLVKMAALEDSGQWEDLRRTAENTSYIFPEEPEPYYYLQRYYGNLGSLRERKTAREDGDDRQLPGMKYVKGFLKDWQQEDFGDARDDIESLVELQPQVSYWWYAYIMAMITDGERENALDLILSCLDSFPQDLELNNFYSYFIEMGVVLTGGRYEKILTPEGAAEITALLRSHSMNASARIDKVLNREAALVLQEALICEPNNFALRDRINGLLGLPSFRRALPDPKISDIIDKRVDPATHPSDDAVVLLFQKRRLVFDNRASLVDYVLAVQILTEDGLQRWENVDLPMGVGADPVVVSMIAIDEDGAQTDGERVYDRVLFPGLKEGDIVLIHYQKSDYVSGKLAGSLWDQHVFAFSQEPCLESVYQIVVPDGFEIDAKVWNADEYIVEGYPYRKAISGKLTRHTFKYKDLPASEREPLAPSVLSYIPWIDLSNISSWSRIADWYADLAEGQAEVDFRVRDKALALTENSDSEEEAVTAIYDFVANEIRYESIPFYQSGYVPRAAPSVLADGFGDCKDKACLMIALLNAAGYDGYHFALVTPNAPPGTPYLPSPRFNHAIVAKRTVDGGVAWYDPTFANGNAHQIPRYLAGTVALIVDDISDSLEMIDTPSMSAFPYSVNTRVAIHGNGDGAVWRQESLHQIDHMAWAREFQGEGGNKEWKENQTEYLATRYPGVKVSFVELKGMEPAEETVMVTSEFLIPYFGAAEDGIMSIKVPWASQLSDRFGAIVAEEERVVPVDMWSMNMCESDTVLIELPGDINLTKVPSGVDLTWKSCQYRTQFQKVDKGLIAVRYLEINGRMVGRTAYPSFKDFLDRVRRDLGRTYHLRLN